MLPTISGDREKLYFTYFIPQECILQQNKNSVIQVFMISVNCHANMGMGFRNVSKIEMLNAIPAFTWI